MLGSRLRVLREAAGVSSDDAAAHIGKNRSTVSRLESGHSPIKDVDLEALLDFYGLRDGQERVALLTLNARLNEKKGWSRYRQHLESWYCSYLVLESAAQSIFTYEARFIPGLLQTPEYAEATIRARFSDDEQVRRLVDIRRYRQSEILRVPSRHHPVAQLWAIIDKTALEDNLDDRGIMRRQIEFLKEADARYRHVTIQVVTRGAHAARSNSFSILRLRGSMLAEVFYLEHLHDAQFIDDPHRSDTYRIAWNEICLAVNPRQRTQDLLDQALRRL